MKCLIWIGNFVLIFVSLLQIKYAFNCFILLFKNTDPKLKIWLYVSWCQLELIWCQLDLIWCQLEPIWCQLTTSDIQLMNEQLLISTNGIYISLSAWYVHFPRLISSQSLDLIFSDWGKMRPGTNNPSLLSMRYTRDVPEHLRLPFVRFYLLFYKKICLLISRVKRQLHHHDGI